MCESLPDISFGDAELFASAKVRSNLRAVNDVFAWQAGDVRARPVDVFAFDDCDALPALTKGPGSDCSSRAATENSEIQLLGLRALHADCPFRATASLLACVDFM